MRSSRPWTAVAVLLAVASSPLTAREPALPVADTASFGAVLEWLETVSQQIRSAVSQDAADTGDTTAAGTPTAAPHRIPPGDLTLSLDDLSRPALLEEQLAPLARLPADQLAVTVANGEAWLGDFSIGTGQDVSGDLLVLRGDADVWGTLRGNLVTANGDILVHPGGEVLGDVLALGGEVDNHGNIAGEARSLSPLTAAAPPATREPISAAARVLRDTAGVVGIFVSLTILGFGLVLFGRRNLEVVADTVSHSFGRAFLTGLIGQLLLLPTFGMVIVGLILSVVGILLLPFAIVVYALLVIIGIVGGFLAVSHAMGETYTRRRLAQGAMIGSPNSYRYLLIGLGGPFLLWLAWALLGWVPVAGDLVRGAALLATWLLGTAGFGAALLSRAGIREQFAGRLIPPEALTDEYLWATPQFGVPAVKRPGGRTPTSGL